MMRARSGVLMLMSLLFCSSNLSAAPNFTELPFHLPAEAETLVVVDLDSDGRRELVTVIDNVIRLYLPTEQGYDFDSGFVEISMSASAVGWDISRGFGRAGGAAIITLSDGQLAQAWHLEDGQLGEPETIATALPGFLTRGLTRLHFARDINSDGLQDLIVPGAGVLHIFINTESGFQSPLAIQSETRTRTALNINRLNRSAGQAIRIPTLELRDVNGDDYADLVSRTEERLDVFLAAGSGTAYFPRLPSYSLDIAAIEERLGEFDIDNLDFSNLTGVLALTHEEILDDVDGDGIEDLLLREGGKVSLYAGTATGMDLDTPRQVLRSGGNVLSTFLYDENEDGLKDLWLWRVEPISVGDIFVWLALSGSIGIEAFVYPNDGERFARRPARRLTVNLRFPSVLRLANAYESLNNEADAIESSAIPPSALANLDEETERADLLLLANQQIRIFLNSINPENATPSFLGPLGYSRQRDNYEIDIREILERVDLASNPRLQQIEGRDPDLTIDLDVPVNQGDIVSARLNADAVDDSFVFTDYDASHIRGILLLSN